jgi:hypothetical protein
LITSCAPALPAKARAMASGMNLVLNSIYILQWLRFILQGQKVQQIIRGAKGESQGFVLLGSISLI